MHVSTFPNSRIVFDKPPQRRNSIETGIVGSEKEKSQIQWTWACIIHNHSVYEEESDESLQY